VVKHALNRTAPQRPAPEPINETTILVAQADGKNAPMGETPVTLRLSNGKKRAEKKVAVVTAAYTLAPHIRTPEQVVAGFFGVVADMIRISRGTAR
jgi:hypothetical protein